MDDATAALLDVRVIANELLEGRQAESALEEIGQIINAYWKNHRKEDDMPPVNTHAAEDPGAALDALAKAYAAEHRIGYRDALAAVKADPANADLVHAYATAPVKAYCPALEPDPDGFAPRTDSERAGAQLAEECRRHMARHGVDFAAAWAHVKAQPNNAGLVAMYAGGN